MFKTCCLVPIRSFLRILLATPVFAFGSACALAAGTSRSAPLTPHERAAQAVARFTFGARPGDIEAVERIGVERWIDRQLHPEHLDDAALQARLAEFPAMRLSTEALIARFPPRPLIRQIDAGKLGLPADPLEREIYASDLAEYRRGQQAKATDVQGIAGAAQGGMMRNATVTPVPSAAPVIPSPEVATLLALAPEARFKAVVAMEPGTVRSWLQTLKPAQRQRLVERMTPQQKEIILALAAPQRVVVSELMEQKLLREIYSTHQLEEVMTDFWFNHFNIFIRKSDHEAWYLPAYERDVIRPHALGRFEDLLEAVAHSPAMLMYLDNQESVGPHSLAAMRAQGSGRRATAGLNENYARELMELHTIGVSGGYTQRDVTELAKVLTGWGVQPLQQGSSFDFNERRHEPGDKIVMGHRIHEHGEAEGREMLHILAESPSTARFLSTKLAIRFVSDTPPPALVDRMTRTYLRTHGDIRKVLKAMTRSPEFWSRQNYQNKLKTPQEFVVSSVRATGADVQNAAGLVNTLDHLGMPLYGVQQPNGYSWKADPWLGGEALLNRMNFALALTSNHIPGVQITLPVAEAASPEQQEFQLESMLLDGDVSPHTHDAVLAHLNTPPPPSGTPAAGGMMGVNLAHHSRGAGRRNDPFAPPAKPSSPTAASTAAALLLCSPDFQKR